MSPCPCSSGKPYADCCRPLHRGQREAATATELMRSRYSAFALKEVGYLWRTLHPDHPDRRRSEAQVLRELRASASTFKYPGLTVLDERPAGANGTALVLFLARLFEKGKERSFVERSEFRHDGTGWRYLRGDLQPLSELKGDPLALTLETFSG
jgi:SEC-C motif-containing protein